MQNDQDGSLHLHVHMHSAGGRRNVTSYALPASLIGVTSHNMGSTVSSVDNSPLAIEAAPNTQGCSSNGAVDNAALSSNTEMKQPTLDDSSNIVASEPEGSTSHKGTANNGKEPQRRGRGRPSKKRPHANKSRGAGRSSSSSSAEPTSSCASSRSSSADIPAASSSRSQSDRPAASKSKAKKRVGRPRKRVQSRKVRRASGSRSRSRSRSANRSRSNTSQKKQATLPRKRSGKFAKKRVGLFPRKTTASRSRSSSQSSTASISVKRRVGRPKKKQRKVSRSRSSSRKKSNQRDRTAGEGGEEPARSRSRSVTAERHRSGSSRRASVERGVKGKGSYSEPIMDILQGENRPCSLQTISERLEAVRSGVSIHKLKFALSAMCRAGRMRQVGDNYCLPGYVSRSASVTRTAPGRSESKSPKRTEPSRTGPGGSYL